MTDMFSDIGGLTIVLLPVMIIIGILVLLGYSLGVDEVRIAEARALRRKRRECGAIDPGITILLFTFGVALLLGSLFVVGFGIFRLLHWLGDFRTELAWWRKKRELRARIVNMAVRS